MNRHPLAARVFLGLLLALLGCSPAAPPPQTITLATTTSTRDSGLLDLLLPLFERQSGVQVKVVAVGSGQALEIGRRGDADVLLTHSPEAELQFMEQQQGAKRRPVMSNDFVLVGPKSDPAGIAAETKAIDVFARIAGAQSPFVSRGDESGTHAQERTLWRLAQLQPQGEWYLQAGAGMAQTLRLASEKQAYTLTDRSTFLAQRDKLQLHILHQGDPLLKNHYAVILVSPRKHPHLNTRAAQQFADFLLSPSTQAAIANFGRDQYGEPLFFPREPDQTPK